MSRADWITVSATLVGTGIAYFVKGPNAAIACVVVGLILSLIMHAVKP
jgi:divalent metal cation (Fe/Co/Zn/Cd) transporter